MSFRDPQTWWIFSLLPQGQYTVSIRLYITTKKVLNVSTSIVGDTSTLILRKETQLAPSARNTFLNLKKVKNIRSLKVRVRSSPHHWLLTQSLPHWSLIDSNLWVEQNVLLTNSWAGQLTVTHWQLAACEWGPLRHQARLSNTYSLGTGWVERKHIKGYLRKTVLILLCSTVNRIKITVRLRLVKIVLKVVWPSQSCWLWTISYTICWECGQVTVVGGA